jgi:hypothetical protein
VSVAAAYRDCDIENQEFNLNTDNTTKTQIQNSVQNSGFGRPVFVNQQNVGLVFAGF